MRRDDGDRARSRSPACALLAQGLLGTPLCEDQASAGATTLKSAQLSAHATLTLEVRDADKVRAATAGTRPPATAPLACHRSRDPAVATPLGPRRSPLV